MTQTLSPDTQVVLDALPGAPHLQMVNRAYAATVLRAVASIPSASAPVPFKYKLFAIAAELEGKSNENPN